MLLQEVEGRTASDHDFRQTPDPLPKGEGEYAPQVAKVTPCLRYIARPRRFVAYSRASSYPLSLRERDRVRGPGEPIALLAPALPPHPNPLPKEKVSYCT